MRLRIDLTPSPAPSRARCRKRNQSFGRVRFGTVPAGLRTLTFRRNAAGRRLRAGRYTLRLQVAGEPLDALAFRVR